MYVFTEMILIYRNNPRWRLEVENFGLGSLETQRWERQNSKNESPDVSRKISNCLWELKVDNDKNWTIFFGLTQVRLINRLYYSSCFLNKTVSNVHKGYIKMFTFLNTNYAVL